MLLSINVEILEVFLLDDAKSIKDNAYGTQVFNTTF